MSAGNSTERIALDSLAGASNGADTTNVFATFVGPLEAWADVVELSGNIEAFEHGYLFGWVFNEKKPLDRIVVDVYEGNRLLGSGVAEQYREDLNRLELGDGRHGFKIDLEEIACDGRDHKVTVVDSVSTARLGTYEFRSAIFARAKIEEIVAGSVSGFITLEESSDIGGFDMELLAEGEVCATGVCTLSEELDTYRFHIKIPNTLFDNEYHFYSARLRGLGTKSNLVSEKLQSILTPWKYLSDNAFSGSLSNISKIAGYRYKALRSQMSKAADSDANIDIKNVLLAHDIVVEAREDRKLFPTLNLEAAPNPLVSIVIPVHNKFFLTYNCIASIILSGGDRSFEVIVVDDMSTDDTKDIGDYIDNVGLVQNKKNLGFLLSASAGAKKAKGEYIVFLNNDTEVTEGWMDSLIAVFSNFDNVGISGSKLIYPDGKLQDAGGIVWGSGKPWNIGNGKNAEDPKYNYARQVDYLSGAALMIDSKVWEEVQGFSEEYVPAYYEDTDLAFKVRAAGYKTIYCPSSVVVHFEGMSNGCNVNTGIKKFQLINAPKFRSKWRHMYRHNGEEGKQNLQMNLDRNVDFRVLMIDYSMPKPDQDAGGYAAINEMSLLQELGCKVTFVPNNMAHMGSYTKSMQDKGVECIYTPFYENIGQFLVERGSEFDLVYITRYDVAEQVIEYVRRYSSAKIVLNNADLHFLRELRAALVAKDETLDRPIQTRDRELKIMRDVDAVLSYNDVEHSVITSHNLNSTHILKCPWVLDVKKQNKSFHERSGIAFLGGFNHLPNRVAVKYFVDNIMPILRSKLDGIVFHVYGSKVTPDIENLACDDVLVEGYVKNLTTVFDNCRVFVAPLLSGAGIKGKVLESISYGVPCVLSSIAAESTGLSHETSTLIARTDDEWVDYICRLYENERQWLGMSKECKRIVTANFSFEQGLEKMCEMMKFIELDPAVNRSPLLRRS